MPLTLDEIKKLPARERIRRLREFEQEQKRLKEEEEKKRKREEEEIITRTVEEIAKEEEKDEEEERLVREQREKEKSKKEESLEKIADEAKPAEQERQLAAYQIRQNAYTERLAQRPATEFYSEVLEARETIQERGYLPQNQMDHFMDVVSAFEQKRTSGYAGSPRAEFTMSEAEKILQQMKEKSRRYN